MHHPTNKMTKLCHGRKQNNTGRKGQMYDCSMSESVLVIIGSGGDLFIYQRVEDFCLPLIWY